jgi:hypothetical protein
MSSSYVPGLPNTVQLAIADPSHGMGVVRPDNWKNAPGGTLADAVELSAMVTAVGRRQGGVTHAASSPMHEPATKAIAPNFVAFARRRERDPVMILMLLMHDAGENGRADRRRRISRDRWKAGAWETRLWKKCSGRPRVRIGLPMAMSREHGYRRSA